eukprot:2083247-Pyramimonas_sp.AAC.1
MRSAARRTLCSYRVVVATPGAVAGRRHKARLLPGLLRRGAPLRSPSGSGRRLSRVRLRCRSGRPGRRRQGISNSSCSCRSRFRALASHIQAPIASG